jgi:hypothetical protein
MQIAKIIMNKLINIKTLIGIIWCLTIGNTVFVILTIPPSEISGFTLIYSVWIICVIVGITNYLLHKAFKKEINDLRFTLSVQEEVYNTPQKLGA